MEIPTKFINVIYMTYTSGELAHLGIEGYMDRYQEKVHQSLEVVYTTDFHSSCSSPLNQCVHCGDENPLLCLQYGAQKLM